MSANPPPSGGSGNVFNRRGLLLVGIGAALVLGLVLVIRFISAKKSSTGSSIQPGAQVGVDANGNPIYAQPGGGDSFINEIAYSNSGTGTQNINQGSNNLGANSGTNTDINYPPIARRRHRPSPGVPPIGGGPPVGVGTSPGGLPAPGPSPVPQPIPGNPVPPPAAPLPPPGGGGGPSPIPSPIPSPQPPTPQVGGVTPPGPSPVPRPIPVSPAPGSPRVYTVQAGDTLASIASRFRIGGGAAALGNANDTTLKQVAVGHGISPAARSRYGAYPAAWDYVYPGEVIHLPGSPSPVRPSAGTGGVPAGGPLSGGGVGL